MTSEASNIDLHPVANSNTVREQVPVIDIGELIEDADAAPARAAIDQIASACRTWGFFQVVNHGIDAGLIADVWRDTRHFFALPRERKLAVLRSRENPWGYYDRELTKNQRDKKEVFDYTRAGVDPIYGQQNRWPAGEDRFRVTLTTYLDECTRLSLKLLEGLSLGLGLPGDFMQQDFAANHTGFMRLNYYPIEDPLAGVDAKKHPGADLGIHHHSDAGALTVLLQDQVSGLQVYRDGYWHDIPVIDGALVINTGDMMQVWSNDIYVAPIHRVLAMETAERYSLPFFFNPSADCDVSPLPTVVSEQNPAHYDTIRWSDFRGKRTDGDYADYGAEVQIAQYRR